jgi:hypothetical protein
MAMKRATLVFSPDHPYEPHFEGVLIDVAADMTCA